ncbi:NYN domain-containing protein [Polynucleobacter sp. MG-27-Goln-C1]|uniref:NYN domain-containing protein n=1 Tax=Polynucleobacter sp. MG-27-Goln-C1 TaxID=1819726 RepID=UPI001C0CA906|nr:NYN domain-containing protein [Polynucleobacter sp. MG-27-Goln-C1]
MQETSQALRTAIYIDGYNLYYGRLRDTQYKWLDVVALFSQITRSIEPHSQIISVKFFTAPALPKFSRHGEESMRAQNDYHRALEAKYPDKFEKVLGSHVYEKDGTRMPLYVEGKPFDKGNTVRVWRLVEKKNGC